MNEQERSLRMIFTQAVEITDAIERAAYLQQACGEDAALRNRIETLLKAHADACGFASVEGGTAILPVTEKPGDRIGRYKLREQIGQGGCGVVYVAEQEESVRRHVALKVIKLGMDTKQVVARFEAERQALALMDHPNIAKVLDAGATETGRPYFVMELVRGIKITDYCDQNTLSTRQRLELFIQVCRAIQHAHQKGIIHRDIKPSNILVTLHDAVPVPKVIDFGIAKATESRLTDLTIYTELHQFIGTPAYMSPEQAGMSGLDIDTRSDIYSLGVLLYELLTGRTPFDAKALLRAGLDQMRQIIREREPVKPSTRLSTLAHADLTEVARHQQADAPKLVHVVRGDLDWIVMKALEKDRARRYETANGLATDVQRHLDNEPVVARPPSAWYHLKKLLRRKRPVMAIGSAVAVSLVLAVALGITLWQKYSVPPADARQALAVVFRPADPGAESLSREFSRNLTHLLSGLSGFQVIPRSQVLKWEQTNASVVVVGKQLGAKMVLLGDLTLSEEEFSVKVELTDVRTGTQLWNRTWQEKLDAGASVQAQIARSVVANAGFELNEKDWNRLRRPWTSHQQAWIHYVRGRQRADKLTVPDLREALNEFKRATEIDPEFAHAYAGLANAHLTLGVWLEEPRGHFANAAGWVKRALELDDSLPEAKVVEGVLKYYYEWDWVGAARILETALRLDPSLMETDACYLHCLDVLRRPDEAIEAVRKALALHPNSIAIQSELSCVYYYAGRFAESIGACNEALRHDPENALHYWGLARALAQQGEYSRAVEHLEIAQQKVAGDWYAVLSELAYIRGKQGRTDEAQRILGQLQERQRGGEYVDPYVYAHIHLGLGDLEQVFRYLHLACDKKSTWIPDLGIDPKFAGLHREARFQQVYARLKLP